MFQEKSESVLIIPASITQEDSLKYLSPIQVSLDVSDFKITGVLDNIFEFGLVNIRYANRKSKDLLKSWIYHLVLCLSDEQNYPKKSHLVCKDETWEFDPVRESKDILENLLALYWQSSYNPNINLLLTLAMAHPQELHSVTPERLSPHEWRSTHCPIHHLTLCPVCFPP
ncbi:MAG: hypothetical protein KKD12_01205, partial [Proteobacteria bacterium]|nr:hypothetical protein [Pseudomonadota bacterium]